MKKYLPIIAISALVVLGLIIFGVSNKSKKLQNPIPPTSQPQMLQEQNTIVIKDYKFSPDTLTVKKGTTIKWKNLDIAKHTITSDKEDIGPKSDFFGQNEEYSYTFNEIGTFAYHCEPHPYMKAKVEVTE